MKRLLAGRGTTIAVMGMLLALVAGGSYALAASGSKTITVCVKKNGGGLYKAKKCKKHDSKLTWNQQGPAGKAGKNGANGLNGAPGSAGAPGVPGPDGFQQIGTWGDRGDTIPGCRRVRRSPDRPRRSRPRHAGPHGVGFRLTGWHRHRSLWTWASASSPPLVARSLRWPTRKLFQMVDLSTTRLPYAISQAASPGAGTWNVGMCVLDDTTRPVDRQRRLLEGYAFVTNSRCPPPRQRQRRMEKGPKQTTRTDRARDRRLRLD